MYSCTNPGVLCVFALVLEGYVQGCSHGGHTFCTNPSGQSPEVGIMKRRSHPRALTRCSTFLNAVRHGAADVPISGTSVTLTLDISGGRGKQGGEETGSGRRMRSAPCERAEGVRRWVLSVTVEVADKRSGKRPGEAHGRRRGSEAPRCCFFRVK